MKIIEGKLVDARQARHDLCVKVLEDIVAKAKDGELGHLDDVIVVHANYWLGQECVGMKYGPCGTYIQVLGRLHLAIQKMLRRGEGYKRIGMLQWAAMKTFLKHNKG